MYKVLIADDEQFIRQGLSESIPWAELCCGPVLKAENGLEAAALIAREAPDIAILDIRMPGKTGVEIAEWARAAHPQLRIILLSGYSDFAYAQAAIRSNVVDYILKPTEFDQVIAAIGQAVAALEAERRAQRELCELRREIRRNLERYRQLFFDRLLYQGGEALSQPELRQLLELYQIPPGPYVFAALRVTYAAGQGGEPQGLLQDAATWKYLLEQAGKAPGRLLLSVKGQRQYGLVVAGEGNTAALPALLEGLAAGLRAQCPGSGVAIGVSRPHRDYRAVRVAMLQANEALEYELYFGGGWPILYDELPEQRGELDEVFLQQISRQASLVRRHIRIGDRERSLQELERLWSLLQLRAISLDTVKAVVTDYLFSRLRSEVRVGGAEQDTAYAAVMGATEPRQLHDALARWAGGSAQQVYQTVEKQQKKLVRMAVEAIEGQIGGSLTLAEVSRQLYVSAPYLSRLIRRECGETFSDLVTRIRMDHAKALLRQGGDKVYEVAEKVGFHDVHYFSNRFKKHTGVTPSEYRNSFEAVF